MNVAEEQFRFAELVARSGLESDLVESSRSEFVAASLEFGSGADGSDPEPEFAFAIEALDPSAFAEQTRCSTCMSAAAMSQVGV
ncbi:hypothetical protein [Streptomyces sp. NPDC006879]|uniref:hypothetical protein n=1 Tax=Streptomyces sp. NPDC006879 TaxID=3364767 RepID=UPI0036806CBA